MTEKRQGRGEPITVNAEDMAEIDRITDEIMRGMYGFQPAPVFERHIKQVLARNIAAARQVYEDALAEEEMHLAPAPDDTYQFSAHHISACSPEYCGRYRGQRRGISGDPVVAKIVKKMYGDQDPPHAPVGPAAYCGACARSGVGACDDYPNCPADRR